MLHETLEYLGIAFVSSVLLIIMSKIILQALIRRPADYYNAGELKSEELMLNAAGLSITREHETNPAGEIIENTHLEAQLGESNPAEPEEIISEIPESVHQSIEIMPEEDEASRGPQAETPAAEAEEAEEPQAEIPPTEAEEAEEPQAETAEQPSEEQFGFSIKAKTSRNRKPRIKEEEEASRELEQAKAAIDEAKAHENDSEPVSEWTESYADIRRSLEKAFTEKSAASAISSDAAASSQDTAVTSDDKSSGPDNTDRPKRKNNNRRNNGRRRTPSMNMNKKELTEIALSRGLEIPPDATKRQILDLIYSDRRNRY